MCPEAEGCGWPAAAAGQCVCNGARAADTGTTFSSSSPHFCMSRRLAASAVSATVAVVAAAGGEIKIMYTFLLSVCHSLSFSLRSVLVFGESSLSVCVCVHACMLEFI